MTIRPDNRRAHVENLAGAIGERNVFRPGSLEAAADYIGSTWAAQGHDVSSQVYPDRGVDCANLEVSIPGRQRAGEFVLVGAHYDSVRGSPGADDNASGVAVLLELGRALADSAP
ncbi:MAG: M28 family peptidase, partial [Acidimicrobiia bacterium]